MRHGGRLGNIVQLCLLPDPQKRKKPMWDWIAANRSLVQVSMSALTALIWIIWLHLITSGLQRQARTEILIYMGGARDLSGRMLVSNLGLEPICVLEIMLMVRTKRGEEVMSVANRVEVEREEDDLGRNATLQGPLKSGEVVEIGSVLDLVERARQGAASVNQADICDIEITVVGVTSADYTIVAAKRLFRTTRQGCQMHLHPTTLHTRQIRSAKQLRPIAERLTSLL